ncbi:MAG: arylesterase [Desulfosarcinaceae bacterium]|jgi:acyl-CoA thioesterase-1
MVDFWRYPKKRSAKEKPGRRGVWLFRLLAVLVLLAALLACTSDEGSSSADTAAGDGGERAASAPATEDLFTIVALGDSLTAGLGVDEAQAYPAVLERRLKADGHAVRVVNAGISGETSSGAVSRLEWVLSSLSPDLVILETGANDGLRGIDTNILKTNLDHLITKLKKADVKVILAGMQMLPNLGPVYTSRFRAVYPQVAKAHDVPLIPFFLEGVAGDQSYNQSDMMHPNAEGFQRIVDHIYPWVVAALP